jgi:predicted MFS family arabinose efflux permease
MVPHPAKQLANLIDHSAASDHTTELRAMAAIAFLVFYGNYMIAPLIPSLAREFAATPNELGWLVPGFSMAYGISTLIWVLSDRFGRTPVLLILLLSASLATMMISFAATARELITLRILSGVGSGGIVTIALASIGDRYPYALQGRPMGRIFGAITAGMGLGSSLGTILNPFFGWRNEFRMLACGLALMSIFIGRCIGSFNHPRRGSYPYRKVAFEYLLILDAPRGGRTMAFISVTASFTEESSLGWVC